MNKKRLTRFINKYYLNGTVNSIVLNSKSNSLTKAGDKSIALKVSDSSSSVNYMLTDTSVINEPPTLKSIPEFELSIDVTPQFINKFIAGKGALGETDNFTIIKEVLSANK